MGFNGLRDQLSGEHNKVTRTAVRLRSLWQGVRRSACSREWVVVPVAVGLADNAPLGKNVPIQNIGDRLHQWPDMSFMCLFQFQIPNMITTGQVALELQDYLYINSTALTMLYLEGTYELTV